MGLLRACADAVFIGAGTLHGSPQTQWTAEHAYPPAAELYGDLRRRRGMPPLPTLAILSGSGKIDPKHPGLVHPAIVLTSDQGEKHLANMLPSSVRVVPLGGEPQLDVAAAVKFLREHGHRFILCEGGPTLLGALTASNLLDEMFLTISPRFAGRSERRPGLSLIENAELLPDQVVDGELLSVRRAGSQVFLRYEIRTSASQPRLSGIS